MEHLEPGPRIRYMTPRPNASQTRPLKVGLILPDTDVDSARHRAGDGWRDGSMERSGPDGQDGRGARLRFHLERGPPHLSLPRQGGAGTVGVLVPARRSGGGDLPGRDRPAGELHLVSQPCLAGEDRRYRRRDLRWAPRSRSRRWLARAGVHRFWLPVRPSRQPLCRGDRHHPWLVAHRNRRFRRNLLQRSGLRAAPARPASRRALPS